MTLRSAHHANESAEAQSRRRLKRPITLYAVGGTAMMFLGFKDATLDIDLVFENEEDKEAFKEAIKEIGYREMDTFKIYGTKQNRSDMLTLGDERFDLFVVNVIQFVFSKAMMTRAEKTHQFGDNFILKIANSHDLILMKCATDRVKDLDDARKIMENTTIDWKILLDEAQNQIKLGKHMAAFELGEFLEKLVKLGLSVPREVLDKLFEIVEKQAEEKREKILTYYCKKLKKKKDVPFHFKERLRMKEKMNTDEAKKIYSLRKITVEPVYGNLKQNLGFREFLLRGLEKAKIEMNLACIAHNLQKIHKILTTQKPILT